ncbi:hypothetical protein HJFPF1_03582 [Paramyrothecium foliicola]|nr:hypothetical protein HJFPF1_03582 [Paramyrothecium foliicola]
MTSSRLHLLRSVLLLHLAKRRLPFHSIRRNQNLPQLSVQAFAARVHEWPSLTERTIHIVRSPGAEQHDVPAPKIRNSRCCVNLVTLENCSELPPSNETKAVCAGENNLRQRRIYAVQSTPHREYHIRRNPLRKPFGALCRLERRYWLSNPTASADSLNPYPANYTPATLDPDLRSQINTLLLRDGHVSKIQESLLHALNAHSTNWPTLIQNHALTLLRSGEVTTFPALLRRVLNDVREDSVAAPAATTNGSKAATNGDAKKVNGAAAAAAAAAAEKSSLAVPDAVIEEALKVTRESLEAVCEIEDGTN